MLKKLGWMKLEQKEILTTERIEAYKNRSADESKNII